MRIRTAAVLAAFATLAAASAAQAATIQLFNTGVDASGTPLANGAAELHYSLAGGPYDILPSLRVATSANGYPIGPWIGDDSSSAWIGPNSDAQLDGPVGYYDYRLTFSLAGLDASTASILGQWATDDGGLLYLNGAYAAQPASPSLGVWNNFSLTNGFQAGTNTLDFWVYNSGGPTGLRVEMSGTADAISSAPEPATWGLMLLGVFGLGGVLRAHKRADDKLRRLEAEAV